MRRCAPAIRNTSCTRRERPVHRKASSARIPRPMASAARWRSISAIALTMCCSPACRCSMPMHCGTRPMRHCGPIARWRCRRVFLAGTFWDEIRAAGATQFNSLGAMTNILLRAPASPGDRDHRVRQAMIVPLSRQSYREVSDRFGVKVTSLYAMTETFAVTMFTPDDFEVEAPRPASRAAWPRYRSSVTRAIRCRSARSAKSASGPASPASSCPNTSRCRKRRCATPAISGCIPGIAAC